MLKFATDIFVAMSVVNPRLVRGPRWIKWTKPPQGSYILNTDGAVKSRSCLPSTEGLIRDSEIHWIGGFMVNIKLMYSLQAELWGVSAGLCLTKSLGICRLVVELDALLVVQFLRRPFENISSRHIHHEGNSCADHLANLAQHIERGLVCLETPSARLKPLLHSDSCGEG
ncbi:hypothetical protein Gotur_009872, partial [Gossypium turneri]